MSLSMLQALIFDFDGLILDTEYPEYLSWQAVYQNHGLALPQETWLEHVGRGASTIHWSPYEGLEQLLGRAIDRDTIRAGRRKHFAELMVQESIRPGVTEWLNAAREQGLKRAVASSSPRDWVAGYLSRLGIEAEFDRIRCADDVTHTKPDPELYNTALQGLGLSADQAVALEDSVNGVAAAKAAGLFCVAVPNALTCNSPLSAADLRVESLADLTLDELREIHARWLTNRDR